MEDQRGYRTIAEGIRKNAMHDAGIRPMIEVRLEVPHCGEHDHEAKIEFAEGEIVVLVRSYRFYRTAAGLPAAT